MRESAIVPSLFFLEIGNALLQAQKAGRIPKDAPFAALEHLEQLPILIEPTSNALAVTHLAAKYDLTTYDAAYLELALRLDIPLLTADQQLKRAGEATKAL